MRGIQISRLRADPRHGGPGQGDLGLVVCAGVGKAEAGAVEQAAGIESVFGNIDAGGNLAYLFCPLACLQGPVLRVFVQAGGRTRESKLYYGQATASLLAGNSFSSCEETQEKFAAVR